MRLVIAAHGSRDADGDADARRFVERVRAALPEVDVRVGFVELSMPPLEDVMREVAHEGEHTPVVVLPLMLAAGGHAKRDIPGAIAAGAAANSEVEWRYADVLGPDQGLVDGLVSRIDVANAGRDAAATTVLLVGRGSSDGDSTANTATTARRVMHAGGYRSVEIAFIAVAKPGVEEGLDRVARLVEGDEPVVVAPYLLFRGLMVGDITGRVRAWQEAHPGALTQVQVADVLGEDDALVELAVRRFCEAAQQPTASEPSRSVGEPAVGDDAAKPVDDDDDADVFGTRNVDAPFVPYPSGLRLTGRRVVVVGGGRVAGRKAAGLYTAGACVTVVSPEIGDRVRSLVDAREVHWEQRRFEPSDLDGAWYVVAATADTSVNEAVSAAAEERRVFCVRADDGSQATAWTPAIGHHEHVTVAVMSDRRPHRSQVVRDQIVAALADGSITDLPGPNRPGPDRPLGRPGSQQRPFGRSSTGQDRSTQEET